MTTEATMTPDSPLPFGLHFIAGLPRSGSTLLAALLNQNPRFAAGMSGPLCGLVNALLGEMSARNEFAVFIDDAQRRRVLTGLVRDFHATGAPEGGVVFDTNRDWTTKLPLIAELFPGARVIACVRHMPAIIDSIERLVRHNVLQPSIIFDFKPTGTVYSRVDGIASATGLVGYAYNALKEAYCSEHADRLMLLQYETLVSQPRQALYAVYEFIGEPRGHHDFDNIDFDASAYDQRAGTPGLHTVRRRVSPTGARRESVLPPDIAKRFENDSFWRDPSFNPRRVRIV